MSSEKGICVGDVLTNFHGILTGVPTIDAGADFNFNDDAE